MIEKLKSINKSSACVPCLFPRPVQERDRPADVLGRASACQRDLLAMGLIHGADLWRWGLRNINRPSATDEEIRLIHFS